MGESRSRPWAIAATAVLFVLLAADLATGPDVVVITLYGIAPLLASLGADWRSTAAVGALALAAAVISRAFTQDMEPANGALFILAVALLGALATGGALIRTRREAAAARAGVLAEASELLAGAGDLDARLRAVETAATAVVDRCTIALEEPGEANPGELVAPLLARGEQLGTLTLAARRHLGHDDRALAAELAQRCAAAVDSARLLAEADEAYGMLDAVFARAPVGLALHDRDLRVVRINDHLAEINGLPAAAQIGRRVSELVPDVEGVEARMRQVLETGRAISSAEISGSTSAAPGVRREFDVSYWPVRRRGDDEILGVGSVVFEVTERRAAERALREQTVRYESLLLALSEVGEAMVVLEDGRLVYANPAFLAISGYSIDELQALPSIFDVVEHSERADAQRRVRLRLEGISDPGYQLTLRHRDGHGIPLEIAGVPLEVGGRTQMIVVGRDVTARARAEAERERLLERAAFLAEASAAFDEVLDEERTLDALARLSVRDRADTCVILLGRSAAAIRRVATVARDPEDERMLRELVTRYPFADRRSHPLLEVLSTGRSRLVEHPDGPDMPAQDEHHRKLIEHFTIQSTVLVPLRARGRILGVMALGFATVVDTDQVSLFEDLGRRAALAIDNARLYEERANVARTLQRSLLPPVLPPVPGVELAARYVAAGEGNEVGGDFYDCFPTGDGEWAVVIGDVCGKGAEAAAVTALARYTVRASATLHSDRPEVVLHDLNEALIRAGPASRFCTVIYVSLSLHDDHVTACVASGGHPLPLILRADGRVETAGMPGTLLGILPDPEIHPQQITLRPGDSLILYTDGVIEASPLDHRFGPEHFARCVSDCHGRAPVAIARHIEDVVLEVQGGKVRDDVAVLVLRVSPRVGAPFVADEPGVAAST
ncbi:MAG TPA: SpoIIE family protein phosphatase [Solirubrobacteraceae bacterium]|nr:SpoIIE family protein phosphatase [Solirubrobacteraceae bacterium]